MRRHPTPKQQTYLTMKQLICSFGLVIFMAISVVAQTNNAILFTENGEKFQVVLNGILQNAKPETNVKMIQLPANSYKCRIIFADAKLGFVDMNMYFPEMGYEATWNIKQNKKGEYVTRGVSAIPIAQAPPSSPSQQEVIYTTIAPVSSSVTTTTVQQTQTTTGATSSDDVNFNMGMNAGGENVSISINASGMDGGMQNGGVTQSSTTTTTTHTVSTTSTSTGMNTNGTTVVATNPVPVQVIYVNGYNGPIGCPIPMSPGDFTGMKESIGSKDFESTKLSIAKQVLQNNCLTSSQVKEIIGLFDFETTKLDYAKYAYDHTYDIGNYYKVNDAFEFETSVDDLNRYISAKK
jgi:hypothetical protein